MADLLWRGERREAGREGGRRVVLRKIEEGFGKARRGGNGEGEF